MIFVQIAKILNSSQKITFFLVFFIVCFYICSLNNFEISRRKKKTYNF